MPWFAEGVCVYKGTPAAQGDKLVCYAGKDAGAKAKAYVRALYANAGDEAKTAAILKAMPAQLESQDSWWYPFVQVRPKSDPDEQGDWMERDVADEYLPRLRNQIKAGELKMDIEHSDQETSLLKALDAAQNYADIVWKDADRNDRTMYAGSIWLNYSTEGAAAKAAEQGHLTLSMKADLEYAKAKTKSAKAETSGAFWALIEKAIAAKAFPGGMPDQMLSGLADWYEELGPPEGRHAACVADVSGKVQDPDALCAAISRYVRPEQGEEE